MKVVNTVKNWLQTARQWWSGIAQRGLRGPASRYAGHLALLLIIALGIVAARIGIRALPDAETMPMVEIEGGQSASTQSADLSIEDLPAYGFGAGGPYGVSRLADIHTDIPTRPRMEIVKYLVQMGDTLFGIADKYGLKPESILWGNWEELSGDPHSLVPGMELSILPVDGALHVWTSGESLTGVAKFFGVENMDIIEWPGNELDPSIDAGNPPIDAGTALVVPGGRREVPTWSAPRITRANPASAEVYGPGHCGSVYDGPVGNGVFIWPTASHYLSGYPYSDIHRAIDIGGTLGDLIFASDAGVVVYSGWNNYGYGNVIMIDHGNGWQTLYAHLSQINVACGQAVFPGNVIGLMGSTGRSTGPHLHFEVRSDAYGFVNPLSVLQ
jgi:murein DD-endopeptidase MepM/ murein hydrolase activator NlpD